MAHNENKKAKNKVREILNGDLSSPLTLNFIIYMVTYTVSILISFLVYQGSPGAKSAKVSDFLQIITDCIVPTTTTLILGNTIQSAVSAVVHRTTRFALTVWALLAIIVYVILYSFLRNAGTLLYVIICLATIGIVVLEMFAIVQVELSSDDKPNGLSANS